MREILKKGTYQYTLDHHLVPVSVREGCSWCAPLTDDTSSKICPKHRDEFYLKALAFKLSRYDFNSGQVNSVVLAVKPYLEKLRGNSHEH